MHDDGSRMPSKVDTLAGTLCTAADTLRLDPPPAPLLPQLYGSGGDNGQLLQFVSDMADKLEARCAARPCGRAKDAGGKAGT